MLLLDRLVPMYLEISILRALYESQASELGARMTAMDAATKNAKEMIGDLTLQYNRARQAAITKELMEIIGGAEALKELPAPSAEANNFDSERHSVRPSPTCERSRRGEGSWPRCWSCPSPFHRSSGSRSAPKRRNTSPRTSYVAQPSTVQ